MKRSQILSKGFTLIELLTAMAITTVILGVLIGTTRMSMSAWKDSRDKARASRLAKESIELMGQDLEGIMIRSGNDFQWLAASMDNSGVLGPSNAEIKNPLEFVFFTAATDRYDGEIGTPADLGGDISAVIYKLVYKDQLASTSQTFPVFSLYRKLINPDVTFNQYYAKTDIKALAAAETTTNPNNFVAENIFNFTVTLIFEYTDAGILTQRRIPIMSSGSGYNEVQITGNTIKVDTNGTELPTGARLAGAELGILVISDSGMSTLNKKSFASSDDFSKFVKENSHYVTKSVILPRP